MAASTGTVTSRPVLFAGLAAGTAITVLAVWDGLRVNVPGVPSILGVVLGVLILWALFAAAGAVLAEVTRRHHRAALRHGWRHGKRGAHAVYRGAARRSRPWRTRALGALRARWDARRGAPEESSEGEQSDPVLPVLMTVRSKSGRVLNPFTDSPVTTITVWDQEDLNRRLTAAAQDPDIEITTRPAPPPESTPPPTEGTTTMTETPVPAAPAPHGGRRVLTIGGAVPGEWKNLVAITADFEPEDDAHLLAWMASEVNGMSGYAEALTEVYETGIGSLGLDPVSLAALHDTADAAAEAAQAMAAARQKFAAHYQEVREFAAAGGLLPHNGRWITGDGE